MFACNEARGYSIQKIARSQPIQAGVSRFVTRLRLVSLTLTLFDVRLMAARLSELAHGNGDIAPFSRGAARGSRYDKP